jgi:hypothetical protein
LAQAQPQQSRGCTIGLSLVPENTSRILDKGPPPTDKEAAAAFREFWGDRAELRRFKDGSILEAVVWEQPAGYGCTRNIGLCCCTTWSSFVGLLPSAPVEPTGR